MLLRGGKWLRWKNVATKEDDLRVWGAWAQDSGRGWLVWSPPPGCNQRDARD
jgi:hypothetical protein